MKAQIDDLRNEIQAIFDHLHQHPEVSWQEVETTNYVQTVLEQNGWRVTRFTDNTGLIGEMGDGERCIALRADMDALWQQVDGVYQANHSCGHDAHMTIILGVVLLLKKLGQTLNGRVKVIFQPAEEKGTGALKMVEKGVADDVDMLFGIHLRPIQELPFGKAAPSILHGSAQFIEGEIQGEESHGARPHLGKNAIEVAISLGQLLSQIHINPSIPHSIKMTKLQAGGESLNIIPGFAAFGLDLRAQTNEVMQAIENKVEVVFKSLSELYSVDITSEKHAYVAAAKVNPEAEAIMGKAIAKTIGRRNVAPPLLTNGGDDFHFYTIERPHLKATMLGLGCDLTPGLHHPKMTFNHEALFQGIEMMTRAVLIALENA